MILKNLEKKVWDFEGFQVRIVHVKGGRDVRSDKKNVGNYNYERQAKGSLNVKEFIARRLKALKRRGWTGRVILGSGKAAHGGMTIENVRKTY